MNSGVSTASFLLGLFVGCGVGIVFAVTRRALADLRNTKAAVPKLRKSFWGGVWGTTKAATGALLIVLLLGWWVLRDVSDDHDTPLVPAATNSPSRPAPAKPATRRPSPTHRP